MPTVSDHPYLEDDEDSFPPHDPRYPDVDPATGDERETSDAEGRPL